MVESLKGMVIMVLRMVSLKEAHRNNSSLFLCDQKQRRKNPTYILFLAPFKHLRNNLLRQILRRGLSRIDDYLRIFRRLIGRIDAGEVFELAGAGFFVQALGIALARRPPAGYRRKSQKTPPLPPTPGPSAARCGRGR